MQKSIGKWKDRCVTDGLVGIRSSSPLKLQLLNFILGSTEWIRYYSYEGPHFVLKLTHKQVTAHVRKTTPSPNMPGRTSTAHVSFPVCVCVCTHAWGDQWITLRCGVKMSKTPQQFKPIDWSNEVAPNGGLGQTWRQRRPLWHLLTSDCPPRCQMSQICCLMVQSSRLQCVWMYLCVCVRCCVC